MNKNVFVIICLALFSHFFVSAQPATSYILSNKNTEYKELTGAKLLSSAQGKALHGLFLGKDLEINPIKNQNIEGIPFFKFNFCGQDVNSFGVLANGIILLGKDSVFASTNLKSTGINNSYQGLHIVNFPAVIKNGTIYNEAEVYGGEGTSISYKILQENNDSVLVLEFKNLKVFLPSYKKLFSTNDTLFNLSYQVRLYKKTSQIDIVYGSEPPVLYQQMMMSTGLRTSSSDKRSIENPKGKTWEEATYTFLRGRSLELNDSVYPNKGFSFTFSLPPSCLAPDSTEIIKEIKVTSSRSTEFNFSGTKPETSDLCLMFFSDSPTMTELPEKGVEYEKGDSLGGAQLVEKTDRLNMFVSKNNIEPGTYYIHAFQANYLCSGGVEYSKKPQTIRVKTLFGAPRASLISATDSSLHLSISAYEGEKVMVAFSERAWDENLDGGGMLPILKGVYQVGDTINKSTVVSKGFPAMRVVYVGEAKDLMISKLKSATPYHFMMWSYKDSLTHSYSSVCNKYGYYTAISLPVCFDFKSNMVQKASFVKLSEPFLAGWSRSIVNKESTSDNFIVSIGLKTASETKTDKKKRLEIYTKLSSQNSPNKITADAISPAFHLAYESTYRVIYKLKWMNGAPFGDFVDQSVYTVQEGDTLYSEVSFDLGQTWTRIDTIAKEDSVQYGMMDDLGYYECVSLFEGKKGQFGQLRLVYTSNHKNKFCLYSLRIEPVLPCDLAYPLQWKKKASSDKSMCILIDAPALNTNEKHNLEYRKIGSDFVENVWIPSDTFSGNEAYIYSLEAATPYEFRVKKVCENSQDAIWSAESPLFYTHYALPFVEDFEQLRFSEQKLPSAWASYVGLLSDTCPVLSEAQYNSWKIGGSNLTGNISNQALSVSLSETQGSLLFLPTMSVSEYPIDIRIRFSASIAKYVSGKGLVKDTSVSGRRSLKILMISEHDCFTEEKVIFQIDTAASYAYDFSDLMNTPIEVRLTTSGNTRFAFYWDNKETNNTELRSVSFYVDDLQIEYIDTPPCDSVYSVKTNILAPSCARISWQGEASEYVLFLKKYGANYFDTLYSTEKELLLESLLPESEYEYYIQSVCDKLARIWSLASPQKRFTTPKSECTTPSQLLCSDSSLHSVEISFVGDAKLYQIEYVEVDSSDYKTKVFEGQQMKLDNLKVHTKYAIRIRAICSPGDTSDFCPEIIVSTSDYPICEVVKNIESEILTQEDVQLRWDQNKEHKAYLLRYKNKEHSDYQQIEDLEQTDYLLQGLFVDTLYVWQVQAVCEHGVRSEFSEEASFKISSLAAENPTIKAELFVWYDGNSIIINNPTLLKIDEILIFDINGREYFRKKLGISNLYRFSQASSFGLMLVRLVIEKRVHTYKLMLTPLKK